MRNKKILIIGFQKCDAAMYPHLKTFIELLSNYCEVEYFLFRERWGHFEPLYTASREPSAWIAAVKGTLHSVIDTIKMMITHSDHDAIIAIDNYAYAIAANVKKRANLILWSHDFVGVNSLLYDTFFVRQIDSYCAKGIIKNKKIIIQDSKRLEALLESLKLPASISDTFFMPVFLEKPPIVHQSEMSSKARPKILQCGGIGRYRYSDDLLAHYQTHSHEYQLLFHGFIFREILTELEHKPMKPMISSNVLDNRSLYQIIDFCDIGFVGYRWDDIYDDRYLSKASGQTVEFLRMGKPVIAMSESDLDEFIEASGVGIGITDMSELGSAIDQIRENYDRYSENSIHCFDEYFSPDTYIPKILDWVWS